MAAISLPANLEDIAIKVFDDLRYKGELFYEDGESEYVSHNGFKVRTSLRLMKFRASSTHFPNLNPRQVANNS